MKLNDNIRKSYSEVYEIIKLLNYKDRVRIPKKVINFLEKEKDDTYVKKINLNVPIKDQNLRYETFEIIALLNLKYLCSDSEREILKDIYKKNEEKYSEIVKVDTGIDDIFKNRKDEYNNKLVPVCKESIFSKILNKIRKIFKVFK